MEHQLVPYTPEGNDVRIQNKVPGGGKYSEFPRQVVDKVFGKVHLYVSGDATLCARWTCGSPENPTLDKQGKVRPDFLPTYNSIDFSSDSVRLDRICQCCFSDHHCRKFEELSCGLVVLQSYSSVRDVVYEALSSDGESCLSSWSLDEPEE